MTPHEMQRHVRIVLEHRDEFQRRFPQHEFVVVGSNDFDEL